MSIVFFNILLFFYQFNANNPSFTKIKNILLTLFTIDYFINYG